MKNCILLIIVFLFFSSLSHSQKTNELLTDEIKDIVIKHEKNIKALYQTRGAYQSWINTDDIDEGFLKSVINKYSKDVAILIYTYSNDSLQLNLLSNFYNKNHKIKIDSIVLQNYIEDTNHLFSSNFLNRAPKLRGSKPIENNSSDFLDSFKKLNDLLLPSELDLSRFEHLIIVPTFNIATLPFSAFSIDNLYLIDHMSYSIAPSLFELMLSSDRNTYKFVEFSPEVSYNWENALFVANPKYPNNLEWEFPDLPGAESEVNYIVEKANPAIFKRFNGNDATKENILRDICEYDLLYFATHGISNSDQPMDYSFLVLADNDTEKSYLSVREIMNIRKTCKLKADLVVLSACQTGLGKSHKGGVIGLARAFQIAGADHVLMSLWNINDSETATLMKYFFNELEIAKELMPHEALRNAILKYKTEVNDDPKYWAAFSIFGVPY